jgi:hypothetical protein
VSSSAEAAKARTTSRSPTVGGFYARVDLRFDVVLSTVVPSFGFKAPLGEDDFVRRVGSDNGEELQRGGVIRGFEMAENKFGAEALFERSLTDGN